MHKYCGWAEWRTHRCWWPAFVLITLRLQQLIKTGPQYSHDSINRALKDACIHSIYLLPLLVTVRQSPWLPAGKEPPAQSAYPHWSKVRRQMLLVVAGGVLAWTKTTPDSNGRITCHNSLGRKWIAEGCYLWAVFLRQAHLCSLKHRHGRSAVYFILSKFQSD